MKRSSAGRASLGTAPLRTLNGNAGTSRSKLPTASGSRSSFGSRSSIGSRPSVGGRLSLLKKTKVGMVQKAAGALTTSRRSSGYGRNYGRETLKDPRPVTSKSYKDTSIRKLVEFLSANGYPNQLSPKMLVSPLARDFLNIFDFMLRFLDPKAKLGKKHEDEIPMSFKKWKYPFQISKSAMFAIGSPHTWPTLLAALTWLREIIEYVADIDVQKAPFQSGDFGESTENKYLFEYIEKAYKTFLQGSDSFEELEEELANNIRTYGEMADMDKIASDNRTLHEELEHLQQQPDMLLQNKESHASLTLDAEKIKNYDGQLDVYIKNKSDSERQFDIELAEMEAEVQALLQDNNRKKQIFEAQEFSLEDVQRINLEKQELHRSIEAVEADIKNDEQQVWAEEVQLGKIQQGIDQKCSMYNQAAAQLRLIPASAEYAGGQDYELTGKATRFKEESNKFVNVIKPGLLQLKKQVKQLMHQTTEERITEAEAVDQMTELVNEKSQAMSLLHTQHKRLEDSIESSRQTHTVEMEKLMAEIDLLQDDLFQMRKLSSRPQQEAKQQLAAEKRQAKLNQEARRKDEEEYISFLERAIDSVITHKGLIQDHTAGLKVQVDAAFSQDMERLHRLGYQLDNVATTQAHPDS